MHDENRTPAGLVLPPGTRTPSHLDAQVSRLHRMQTIVDDPQRLKGLLERLPRVARRVYAKVLKKGGTKVQAMLAAVARSQA